MGEVNQTTEIAKALLPCPFCGARILHVESWARSFDPPRLYHEYHHPAAVCVLSKLLESFSDDDKPRQAWIEMWNRRVQTR